MSNNLGAVASVASMTRDNSIFVEIGGSVRRIKLSSLIGAIQSNQLDLSLIAWGTYLRETSDTEWGVCGNQTMWNNFKASLGRYLLTNDGKMAKLSKTNSAYFEDGTAVDESKGHIMFHCPNRIYYLVKYDATAGCNILWGSTLPISEYYFDHPTFGAYMAAVVSGKLVSRSGLTVKASITISPYQRQNNEDFFTYAQANGKDFGVFDYDHIRLIGMLCLWESGSPNSQAKFGCGPTGSTNTWNKVYNLATGATKSLGDNCGKISLSSLTGNADACHVNLFGIENPWGWYWQMIQGIYFGNSQNDAQNGTEVYIYKGNRMPSSAELASHPNGDYRQTTRLTTPSEAWIAKFDLGEQFDLVPKQFGGGSANYWCDYSWQNSTGQLLLWGGSARSALPCGAFYVSSNYAFGLWDTDSGVRLAFYGTPKYVDGAEL